MYTAPQAPDELKPVFPSRLGAVCNLTTFRFVVAFLFRPQLLSKFQHLFPEFQHGHPNRAQWRQLICRSKGKGFQIPASKISFPFTASEPTVTGKCLLLLEQL